jgi:hypothetical protein
MKFSIEEIGSAMMLLNAGFSLAYIANEYCVSPVDLAHDIKKAEELGYSAWHK